MPAVSVIILAFNSGDLLGEAVDSILDQSLADLELLIIDNGSTDGAVERVQRTRPDPRVRVVRQETNLGIARGLNLAVPLCAAPWIALMDHDDRAHPLRLELQLRAAASDPALAVIGTGATKVDAAGREQGRYPMFYTTEDIVAGMPYNLPLPHPTLLVRREVYAQFSYRPEWSLAADYDWAARAIEVFKFGVVSLPLYQYRRHPESATVARLVASQAEACAIRLAIARRRAGRDENLAELVRESGRWREAAVLTDRLYANFASLARTDGFALLAAFHSSLAVRQAGTLGNRWRYLRDFTAAARSAGGFWRTGAEGAAKGPWWILLREAGYPGFPRY